LRRTFEFDVFRFPPLLSRAWLCGGRTAAGIASTCAAGWLTTVAPSRPGAGRGPGAGARPGDPSSPAGHDPREARGHTSRRSN